MIKTLNYCFKNTKWLGVFFILFTITTSNIHADDYNKPWENADQLCKKFNLDRKCLKWLLTMQCIGVMGIQNTVTCEKNSYSFTYNLNAVDITKPNEHFPIIVAFENKLRTLIFDPKIHHYLKELNVELENKYRFQESFNLWDFTFEKMDQNKIKTLEVMAVLFQDTFGMNNMVYFDRLFDNPEESWIFNIPPVNEALSNLNSILQTLSINNLNQHPDQYKWLELYPTLNANVLNKELDRSLYHFYVPAYLASKTSTQSPLQAMLAFEFNAQYELSELKGWPYSMPKSIDLKTKKSSIMQIYAGFQGAHFGSSHSLSSLSSQVFTYRMALLPSSTMKMAAKTLYAKPN